MIKQTISNADNMDQVYIPQRDYKVLVDCKTYNQSKYIEDALNGFSIQQTDFPFVCLVMDDCSTDGEQDVIKSWMARECDMEKADNLEIEKSFITLVPHKSNTNCHFAFYFLKQNLYKTGGKAPLISPWREHCEYEAFCEGDDYWIHPDKLQMQTEFLNENEEYSFCHTGFDILYDKYNQIENGDKITSNNERILASGENLMEAIIDGNRYRVLTLTNMYRLKFRSVIDEMLLEFRDVPMIGGHTSLSVFLLSVGKIGFLPIRTSIYRSNANSVSNQSNFESHARFSVSCEEMRLVLAKQFGLSRQLIIKRQKIYQHILNIYYCYNRNYHPFVEVEFNTIFDRLLYNILRTPIVIPILRQYHQIRLSLASRKKAIILKK